MADTAWDGFGHGTCLVMPRVGPICMHPRTVTEHGLNVLRLQQFTMKLPVNSTALPLPTSEICYNLCVELTHKPS